MKKLRIGFLSTAGIGQKNWKAIFHSGNAVVSAVASRDLKKCRQFIDECQREFAFFPAPRAFGSYEELLASPDVDAVYIPLPTALRKSFVLQAAANHKHVVCEKPCATDSGALAEMIAACQQNNVQFMDGVMFMHSERLQAVRKAMAETVGRARWITLVFSFGADKSFFTSNIRGNSALEPHGCVGDLGWYCIRFALWAAGWKMPRQATGRLLAQTKPRRGAGPVPIEFSGELLFDGGLSAGFYVSFVTELQQLAQISGDRGYLRLNDFVLPHFGSELEFETCNSSYTKDGCIFNLEPGWRRWTTREHSNSHSRAQESNMFRHFAAQIQSGKLNKEWPEMALKTQRVMEACLESAAAGRGPS